MCVYVCLCVCGGGLNYLLTTTVMQEKPLDLNRHDIFSQTPEHYVYLLCGFFKAPGLLPLFLKYSVLEMLL
jgi:hypothetical protein